MLVWIDVVLNVFSTLSTKVNEKLTIGPNWDRPYLNAYEKVRPLWFIFLAIHAMVHRTTLYKHIIRQFIIIITYLCNSVEVLIYFMKKILWRRFFCSFFRHKFTLKLRHESKEDVRLVLKWMPMHFSNNVCNFFKWRQPATLLTLDMLSLRIREEIQWSLDISIGLFTGRPLLIATVKP